MLEIIMWIMLFAVLAGAGFVGYVFLTGQSGGFGGTGALFGPKPEKRLDVVDQTSVDARRRLVLIRRDNVEHLIMTGGPVDVVIETGIGERPQVQSRSAPLPTAPVPAAPVFGTHAAGPQASYIGSEPSYPAARQPRSFGTIQAGQPVVTKAAE